MASRQEQKEAARRAREEQESAAAAEARRTRVRQLGIGGVLLAAVVVTVLVAVSQHGGSSTGTTTTPAVTVHHGKAHGAPPLAQSHRFPPEASFAATGSSTARYVSGWGSTLRSSAALVRASSRRVERPQQRRCPHARAEKAAKKLLRPATRA